jgi:hypothetical protein
MDLARSKIQSQPEPATVQPEPKQTGTKPKLSSIPGLTLTKSQKKKERNRERKRKQRAKTESEALDTSAEDKLAQSMLSWIKSSKQSVTKLGTEADTEESDDPDTANDTVEAEKESFDKKVLEESAHKSFFEDNPFNVHETYRSLFATRLSLTPQSSRPASTPGASQPFSTPKRPRSPSPDLMRGIKSIKKQ